MSRRRDPLDHFETVEFPAMGTTVAVTMPETLAPAVSALARATFEEWEKVFSRFRPDSELNRLNRHSGRLYRASSLLYRAVQTALEAARETDGLFDPTLGRHLGVLGYDRSWDEGGFDRDEPVTAMDLPGGLWRQVKLYPTARAIWSPPGTVWDLGGLVKGLTVDAVIAACVSRQFRPVMVNAGGDLAVWGVPQGWAGWPVMPPWPGGEAVLLLEGALATSGVTRRRWRRGTDWMHHLLDPRSGQPTRQPLWTVTVAAPSCAMADVAAKTAFIRGPQEGRRFLERLNYAGAFWYTDGHVEAVGPFPLTTRGGPV